MTYPNTQLSYEPRFRDIKSSQYTDSTIAEPNNSYSSNRMRYSTSPSRYLYSETTRQSGSEIVRPSYESSSSFAPLTKVSVFLKTNIFLIVYKIVLKLI